MQEAKVLGRRTRVERVRVLDLTTLEQATVNLQLQWPHAAEALTNRLL